MKRSFAQFIAENGLKNDIPSARHFFFSKANYKADIALVEVPFENDYGDKNTINIASGADVTLWSLRCPYNPKGHSADLINYSAKVRKAPAFSVKDLEKMKIEITFSYHFDAYTPPNNGEKMFRSAFVIEKTETFRIDREKALPHLRAVWYLNSDNVNWSEKLIFDFNRGVKSQSVNFVADQTNSLLGDTIQPSMIKITNKKDFSPQMEFQLNNSLRKHNLAEGLDSVFDIFVPKKADYRSFEKFSYLNLFDDLWPSMNYTKGQNRSLKGIKDYKNDIDFFKDNVNYKKNDVGIENYTCLFSTKNRTKTDSTFLFHFKEASINVKAGSFYITNEAFEMMKTSLFFKEAIAQNRITVKKRDVKSIADSFTHNDDEQTKEMLSFLKQGTERSSLTKITITDNFIFYDIAILKPQSYKFNRMFAFEIGNPGQSTNFKHSKITNSKRKLELISSGVISNVKNFHSNNIFENSEKALAKNIEDGIKHFYKLNGSTEKNYHFAIREENIYFPNIDYDLNLSPSSPDQGSTNEVYYIYNENANEWHIPNLNLSARISGACIFNDATAHGSYFSLIESSKYHSWKLPTQTTFKNFNMQIFDANGNALPGVTSNNKVLPLKDIGFSFNEKNRLREMDLIDILSPSVHEYILVLNAKSESNSVTYSNVGDADIRKIVNKYPFKNYKYLMSLENVVLPTKFPKNTETSYLFVKVVGLENSPIILHNGVSVNILGCLNLSAEGDNWRKQTSKDANYALTLTNQNKNTPHTNYKFEIKSLSELNSFTITLLNQDRQEVLFTTSNLRPQYNFKISVHNKYVH